MGTISKRGREKQAVRDTPGGLRIVYGLGAISGKDTKSSIQRCQIITGRRMEKAVQKAAVNWEVNNCIYNWTSDRKTGRFATANEVKSVTSHEVINNNAIYAADRIKCIQPLTGESPTELQKRARQEAAVQKEAAQEQPQEEAQGAEPGTTDTPEKPFEPESIYKVRQNPYSDSPENSSILQEYVTQDNGMAKLGDILYTGTPEKCRELWGKLEAGELTQGDVKELYAKAQEAQHAAEPGQETPEPPAAEKEPDKDTFSIYQLKRGDETRDYRFEPYDRLQAAGLSVEAANYDLIYTAPLAPDMTLEDISVRFNIDHPKDFKGHSLSTSDVVVLHQNG